MRICGIDLDAAWCGTKVGCLAGASTRSSPTQMRGSRTAKIAHRQVRTRSTIQAASRLARALERAEIHGVTTNRDLLTAILREPEFLAGATDTGYPKDS